MKKMKTTKWVTLLALIMLLLTPPRALFAETELVTQELRITNDAEPLSVVVSSSTYNSGCTTATVTFTISGGTAPYQYKVDDGTFATIEGNSITLSDLPLGNHIIYILDAVDERASTTIALSPVQLIAAESASICSGQSVSLSVTASGGTAPYTFSWKEGGTEVCSSAQYDFPATTVTAATAHTYDVTVTDENNCSATTTTTLTINPNPAEPNITGTLAVCPGSGVNLGVDDPSGDLTYTWTSTETVIDNSTSITSCDLWVPTYFTLTAKDVNGCTSSTTKLVTINDTVKLQVINPTQTICLNQEITPIICTYENATINTSDITLPTGLTLSVEEPEEGEGVPTIIIAGAITTGGTYTFNITATSNQDPECNPKTQDITIVVRDYSGPTLTSTITDVKCYGDATGSISVTATGGDGTYQYQLNDGTFQDEASFSGLTPGSYTITVKDGNGCSTTESFAITQPNKLDATIATTAVKCNGGTDGIITITATGGTTPRNYSISPVTGTGAPTTSGKYTFSDLTAGTYTVTVKDTNNCVVTKTGIQVTEPAVLTASATTTPASCNGVADGTITITANGGNYTSEHPYTYTLSNGTDNTTGEFTGIGAGTYSVTVEDVNGCTASVSNITVSQPDVLEITSTSTTPASCNGVADGTITITANGGNYTSEHPYTYTLSNGTDNTTGEFTGIGAGTYSVTVEDVNGCTASVSNITVSQPDVLEITSTSTTPASCNGVADGTITITANGGNYTSEHPYTYTLSNGTTTTAITAATSATFNDLSAGNYTVTVTDYNNCEVTKTGIQVTQPDALPTITITAPSNICSPHTTTITAAGGVSYLWNDGSTTASITISSAGTYSVTGTDAIGCQNNATVTIEGCLPQLTITSASESWTYDGNPHANNSYAVTYDGNPISAVDGSNGLKFALPTGDTLRIASTSSPVTNVADSYTGNNTFTYTLDNDFKYPTPSSTNGTLTVTARPITLTANSKTNIMYDGHAHTYAATDAPHYTISAGSLVSGQSITDITITGSGTAVGTYPTAITAGSVVIKEGETVVTSNYDITLLNGKLVINNNTNAIAITSASDSWTYDGTAHTKPVYTVTYGGTAVTADASGLVFTLPTGDKITITSTGSITNVGSTDNTFTYELENAAYYTTPSTTNGTLTVTARPITLTANSTEIMYDGHAHTYAETVAPHYTISGDGLASGQSITDITITGSGTAVGTYPTAITAGSVVIKEGETVVTGNYNITLVNGELVIGLPNMKDSLFCNNSTFNTLPTTGHPDGTITYTWTVVDNPNVTGESNMTTPQSSISQVLSNNNTTAVETVIYTVTPHTALGEELFPFELQVSVYPSNILSITCPDDIDIMLNFGECDYTFTTIGNAATSYSNSIFTEHNWNVTLSNNAPADLTFSAGNHVVVWTLSDECGNTVTCTQNVNINYPACPDAVDFDNNVYPSVRIGCECWTAVNLRSVHYADGSIIDDRYSYTSLLYPDAVENVNRFGELYSYYAAVKAPEGSTPVANAYGHIPGICPDGWYLPTEEQFLSLNAYPVIQLKSPLYWINGGGTNETGFSALPAGYYDGFDYRFKNLYGSTYFWSTSNDASAYNSSTFSLNYACDEVTQTLNYKGNGYSIRCIKEK